MGKLSDKKFIGSSGHRTAAQKPAALDKKALKEALDPSTSAEALFDKLAQMFGGEGVNYMDLAREIVNFTGLGNRDDMVRAVMQSAEGNPNVDPDKLMKIVTELQQSMSHKPAPVQKLPQAPAPQQQQQMAAGKSAQMDLMAPAMGQVAPQPKKTLQPVHAGMASPTQIKKHYRKLRSMGYGIDDSDMAVTDALRQGLAGEGAEDDRVKDYFRRLWYSTISTKPHEESLYKLASLSPAVAAEMVSTLAQHASASDDGFADATYQGMSIVVDMTGEQAELSTTVGDNKTVVYAAPFDAFNVEEATNKLVEALSGQAAMDPSGASLGGDTLSTEEMPGTGKIGQALSGLAQKIADSAKWLESNGMFPQVDYHIVDDASELVLWADDENTLALRIGMNGNTPAVYAAPVDSFDPAAAAAACDGAASQGKVGQREKAFQVQVQWQKPTDPQMAKTMRDRMLKTVNNIPSIQISEDSGTSVIATAWNTDEFALQKVTKALQQQGAAVEVRRVAQMAAPAAPSAGGMPAGDTTPMPPAGAPAAGPAPAPADLLGDGMGEEDLSLEDALEQLDEASKVVVEKVQSGEALDSSGQELIPEAPMDTGATPAPPAKVAVDNDAKSYWHDLFGEYGDQMTEDRVASIVDSIESVYGEHGIELTDDQFNKMVAFVEEAVPSHSDADLVSILERALLNYTASHKTFENGLDIKLARHAMHMAIHETGLKANLGKYIAQKMKTPSVKGQPDDAVKVEHAKDEASKSEQKKQIAHIPMEYEDLQMRGKYLHFTVKWDADAEAAKDKGDEALMHAVTSFVKGIESQKEFKDFGFLGAINFSEFDADAGLAEVYVLSSKGADAVPVVDNK
jgi:hypothetical protein